MTFLAIRDQFIDFFVRGWWWFGIPVRLYKYRDHSNIRGWCCRFLPACLRVAFAEP